MSIPAWEIPFNAIGKVIEAVPVALYKVAKDATEADSILHQDVPALVTLLDDAAVAVTDKGLNFALDGQVAKDFLALLASIKSQLGIKAAAAPAPVAAQ